MSKLSAYIKTSGLTQKSFAEKIGVSTSYLSELIGGKTPSLSVAVNIERETGGAVSATSWVPVKQSQSPSSDTALSDRRAG